MSPVSEAGIYLIQSLGLLYLMILIFRFLLQAARADFNNPVSRFLIKATHMPTTPIRKVLPAYRNFDLATLVLAIVLQCLVIQLSVLILGHGLVNVLYLLAWAVTGIISLILNIYLYGLLAVIIISWVAPYNRHPIIVILHQLLDPVMKPFQRLIPPLGGLDLSPIFIFLVLNMLRIFLHAGADGMRLPLQVVPGI